MSTDMGPQFTSQSFQTFLKKWVVKQRISSAEYPQSNGRVGLGVKTAKRIIHDNFSSSGTVDNDKVAKALLQYRNTPLPDIQLSPGQLLLHKNLRDYLPMNEKHYHLHEEWISTSTDWEKALAQKQ